METEQKRCFIWDTPATSMGRLPDKDGFLVEGSQQAGGDYQISAQALKEVGALEPTHKAKLTTMLLDLRQQGEQRPLVTSQLIENAKRADPLPPHKRAERLLRYWVRTWGLVGERRDLSNDFLIDLTAYAWSESTEQSELVFFVNYLTARNWLQVNKVGAYAITVSGYERVAEQAKKTDLSQCFVAMWFDPSMNQAYEDGIKKAVEECGYTPLRIDQKLDVNKIDDEIIAEIRRARFVVADFTHDKEKGVRGGVYYEAGFAHGLDLPVIYSCRENLENELHFDTRQYHHILWKTPEDLCTQLRNRIRAIVGDYRAEPAPATL